MRGRIAACFWLWTMASCLDVLGGGLRDLDDAWLMTPLSVLSLLTDRPASDRYWQVRSAHGRLYGLPELEQVGLEFERRGHDLSVAAAWQRLGGDLYRESIWRLDLLLGRRWRLGGRFGLSALDVAGERLARQTEFLLALQFPLSGDLVLQAWCPLTQPPPWYGEHGLRRWLSLQKSGAGWIWAVAVDRSPHGRPSLQGEVLLRLAAGAALGLRCEPATGTVGLCTAWRPAGMLLRSSHALHPDLGPSHRWQLAVGGCQ